MKFSIEELRPIRNGMTISRDSKLGNSAERIFFLLFQKPETTKSPHVRKEQFLSLIKVKDQVCVLFFRVVFWCEQKASGHTKMQDHTVTAFHTDDQKFSAALYM